jgi:exosortase
LAFLPSVDTTGVSSQNQPGETSARDHRTSFPHWIGGIHPRLAALAVGLVILACAYWPNLRELYTIWTTESNYSHGLLVIPLAAAIFWQRLADGDNAWSNGEGQWWSWALLVAVLAARLVAYERNNQWLETATIVLAVGCLILTLGGWPLLKQGWPAVVFLLFMLPLPQQVNNLISLPLQFIATGGSVFMMQLTGLWATAEGNVIILRETPFGPRTMNVAEACNGLSMLMTLAATVVATIMLFPMANWKRVIVLASAIPIALVSNIVRIVVTGWCYYLFEGEVAKQRAHDWTGIVLMMPLALLLVVTELVVLSWLAGDNQPEDRESSRPILAMLPPER